MDVTLLVRGAWGATRILALALVFGTVVWGLGSDAPPAGASHTKIVLSKSATSPIAETSLILPKNGSPVDFYVWAVNVHNSTGASAFDIRFEFDPALLDITFLEWYDSWISNNGYRSPACIGGIGPNAVLGLSDGQAYAHCSTFNIPPPYGATGTGLVAHVRIKPGNQLMFSGIDMTESFLVDTPPNPDDEMPIPAAVPYVYMTISKCADFDLNGEIDLFNDIFGVANRFGMEVGNPQWEAKYDLDDSGNIDLFNDIFNSAYQFGGSC
jgi:hypothetical protein